MKYIDIKNKAIKVCIVGGLTGLAAVCALDHINDEVSRNPPTYDNRGNVIKKTAGLGLKDALYARGWKDACPDWNPPTYDSQGNLIRRTSGWKDAVGLRDCSRVNSTITYEYDNEGNVIKATDNDGDGVNATWTPKTGWVDVEVKRIEEKVDQLLQENGEIHVIDGKKYSLKPFDEPAEAYPKE